MSYVHSIALSASRPASLVAAPSASTAANASAAARAGTPAFRAGPERLKEDLNGSEHDEGRERERQSVVSGNRLHDGVDVRRDHDDA